MRVNACGGGSLGLARQGLKKMFYWPGFLGLNQSSSPPCVKQHSSPCLIDSRLRRPFTYSHIAGRRPAVRFRVDARPCSAEQAGGPLAREVDGKE